MSIRDSGRGAELRAERVRWRGRSQLMSQILADHGRATATDERTGERSWTSGYVVTQRKARAGTGSGTTHRRLASTDLAVLIGDIGQSHEGRLVGAGGVGSVVVVVVQPAFECATALGL